MKYNAEQLRSVTLIVSSVDNGSEPTNVANHAVANVTLMDLDCDGITLREFIDYVGNFPNIVHTDITHARLLEKVRKE
jgi:hypothetical protein